MRQAPTVLPLTDTTPEADRVFTDAFRAMSVARKWIILGEAFAGARTLHAAGVRLRNPGASHWEIHDAWIRAIIGCPPGVSPSEPAMGQGAANLDVLRDVVGVFGQMGIAYALGGSMASSLHGIARFTRDADVTAEPFAGKEEHFVRRFGPEYYLSLPAVQDAVRNRSSFNIIHTTRGFKVDVFIRSDDPFERSALDRRLRVELPDRPEQPLYLHTAEDVILLKLKWYRLGGETSSQQWSDVAGVLKVQAGKLDRAYLAKWAAELGVGDLLTRSIQESTG